MSKEDALSERLKTLRTQSAQNVSPVPRAEVRPVSPGPGTAATDAQPRAIHTAEGQGSGIGERQGSAPEVVATDPAGHNIESLLDTDDQTLEELLADLGADEQWLEEVATEFSANDEHHRVNAILEELNQSRPPKNVLAKDDHDEDQSQDDDSDGEHMTRETGHVLAKALDEVNFEKLVTTETQADSSESSHPREGRDTEALSGQKSVDLDPFNLPAVPTELRDQPDTAAPTPHDGDFEAHISSRLAALKGLGGADLTLPSAPTSKANELGLPGVPSFAPGDRPATAVYKRPGYSNEEEKSWCTICMEDGAIRCIGCESDIYCARCWKEMHVGSRANYDDRGHKWEKYVKTK